MYEKTISFIKDLYGNQNFVPLSVPKFIGNEKKYLDDCIDTTFVSSVGQYVDRFRKGFADTLDDAIYVRKHLARLYMSVLERDEEGFMSFASKYGFYDDYEYVLTPISIDHIMHEMTKASYESNE